MYKKKGLIEKIKCWGWQHKRGMALLLAICMFGTGVAEVTLSNVLAASETTMVEGTGPETENTTGSETEIGTEAEPETEAGTETEAEPETEAAPETEAEPGTEAETETEKESETEAEPETETEAGPETAVDKKTEEIEKSVVKSGLERTGETDWTNDTSEISLTMDSLVITKPDNGGELTVPTKTENGNTIYDMSALSYYDIGGMKFSVTMKILNDTESRQIREGDYFLVAIPNGFDASSTSGTISSKGIAIATYSKEESNLKFVFTKNADITQEIYTSIAARADLSFSFKSNEMKEGDRDIVVMDKTGTGGNQTILRLPTLSTVIDGIKKEGTFDSAENTVTWDITVGTTVASRGNSVKGIVLTEKIGEGQEFVDAWAVDAKGNKITGAVSNTKNTDGTVSIAIKEDINAPAMIKVKTGVTEQALTASQGGTEKGKLTFSNEVEMTAPVGSGVVLGEVTSAGKTIETSYLPGYEKMGTQIDSDTIEWTIVVNKGQKVNVYKGEVTDTLPAGLEYKTGSMRYYWNGSTASNTPGEFDAGDSAWQPNSLAITKNSLEANRQELKFYMAESSKAEYKIVFQTTLTDPAAFTADKVENKATVTAQFPYWNNGIVYKEWDYGIPECETEFVVSTIRKEVSANSSTGILTWTIYPSTRTAFTSAKIEDEIEAIQTYGDDAKVLKVADGTLVTDKFDISYNGRKLTVAAKAGFAAGGDKLSNYKIVYTTRADKLFQTNKENVKFSNTAKLWINGSFANEDSADVTLKNEFLAKSTKFEYVNGEPYFHYRIEVNGNGMELNQVVVEDSLNTCSFRGDDASIFANTNWEWDDVLCTVNNAAGGAAEGTVNKAYANSRRDIKITLSKITQKHTIHLYAKLTDAGKSALTSFAEGTGSVRNKKIYSENTVKVKSNEVTNPETGKEGYFSVTSTSKGVDCFNNMLVTKTASTKNGASGLIDWTVEINPLGGPLVNPVITDTIPKAQKYVESSIELFSGVRVGTKLETGTKADLSGKVTISAGLSDRTLKVIIPDAASTSKSYILKYQTAIVDNSVSSIENKAILQTEEQSYGADSERVQREATWGTLESCGALRILKYDASVGSSMPLDGVKIAVYSDAACNSMVDVGVTGAAGKKGEIIFYGLDIPPANNPATETYYVKELEAPEGYVKIEEPITVAVKRGLPTKPTELEMKNERKQPAAEDVSKVELTKTFSYKDSSGRSVPTAEKQAEFKLTFYPYGTSGGSLVTTGAQEVKLQKESDGNYRYDSSGATTILTNDTAGGKIIITGLPWGHYGLKEINTADGFAVDKAEKYFEISYDDSNPDGSKFAVTYKFGDNTPKDNGVLLNGNTSFSVKKFEKGTSNSLPDVKLQICKKTGETLTVVTDALNGNTPYEWTTVASEAATGHIVNNLPAGDYVLHEAAEGTDTSYAIADDIEFSLDINGELTRSDAETVTDHTLIMYNSRISLEIKKQDQYNSAVSDAVLQMTGHDSAVSYSQTKTTGADGSAEFTGLKRGCSYTITETDVPQGYAAMDEVTVKVSGDGNSIYLTSSEAGGPDTQITEPLVLLDRKLLVQLKIQKADSLKQDTYLSGAGFELYRKTGTDYVRIYDQIQTAEKQMAGSDWTGWDMRDIPSGEGTNSDTGLEWNQGINPGEYYLKEITVPAGYKAAANIYFTINEQGYLVLPENSSAKVEEEDLEKIVIFDEPYTLQIKKTDADSGDALSGADYRVQGVFAAGGGEESITLAEDASARRNQLCGKLVPGNVYSLTETKAPLGYKRAEKAYFKLAADGTVTVTDSLGNALTRTDVTAENPAEVTEEEGAALHVSDEKIKVEFVKLSGENRQRIDGAEFTITGTFADAATEKTLKPNGQAAILEGVLIEDEVYTLIEKQTPVGYQPLEKTVKFKYTTAGGLELISGSDTHANAYNPGTGSHSYAASTLEIVNDSKQNTSLAFKVIDCTDGSGIPQTTFTLSYDPGGGSGVTEQDYVTQDAGIVYTYDTVDGTHSKTTVAGECFVTGLKPGKYTLTEKTPAYAYEMGKGFKVTFTVDADAKNKTIFITKTNIENGAYDLQVADGSDPVVVETGICNKRVPGTVVLEKKDGDTSEGLDGVGFEIYKYREADSLFEKLQNLLTGKRYEAAATAVWTQEANDKGKLTITELEWGRYYIVETNPLDGYALDKSKHEFEIGKDKQTQVLSWSPATGTIVNSKIQLEIQQLDAQNEAAIGSGHKMRLSGAFRNTTDTSIEWTVTDEAYIVAGQLIEGETYTLEETSVLQGHTSAVSFSFRYLGYGNIVLLSSDSNVQVVVENGIVRLVQKLQPIQLRIRKTNKKDELLAGAELELYRKAADGTETLVVSWTSTAAAYEITGAENGHIEVGATYVLKEKAAPSGYAITDDVQIILADTPDWQEMVMVDERSSKGSETEAGTKGKDKTQTITGTASNDNGVVGAVRLEGTINQKKLPRTGREERAVYIWAGVFMMLAGAVMCIDGRKKKRK